MIAGCKYQKVLLTYHSKLMDNVFEQVKDKLNIRQVIEHYGCKVNRANQFICPFHNDHKPSASIKNDYFHCFVCGAGGDLITFTAKLLGLSNIDAVKELVRVFGLNVDIRTFDKRKAEHKELLKRKAEIKKQATLRDKFEKDKELRADSKKHTLYKLRNELRQSEIEKAKQQEEYILHCSFVLADFHRFLWQGVHLYPFEHKRHIQALQELTVCEYYLECFDSNPIEFIRVNKGVIERYERELNRQYQQG